MPTKSATFVSNIDSTAGDVVTLVYDAVTKQIGIQTLDKSAGTTSTVWTVALT